MTNYSFTPVNNTRIILYYDMIQRINATCNTAALVPSSMCFASRSLLQWTIMRTVPSRRENNNVPSRAVEKKVAPWIPAVDELIVYTVRSCREIYMHRLRPVEQKYIYICRPVPSWQFLSTIPSSRDICYLPSRPMIKQKGHWSVPSRPRQGISHPPSRPIQATTISTFLPSRPVTFVFFPPLNMSKHYRPVCCQPWKPLTFSPNVMNFCTWSISIFSTICYHMIRDSLVVYDERTWRL